MINSNLYLLSLVTILLITTFGCSEDTFEKAVNNCPTKETNQVTLPNGDFLTIPACWEYNRLSGIDSDFGEIRYDEDSLLIYYDIGEMASTYVDADSPNKRVAASINEIFWYEVVDRGYINDEDCCVFVTFPDRGPANFITLNDEHLPMVFSVIQTYQSN